jgi:hypothetical protein
MTESWPNIPYLIKLPRLSAYLSRLGGYLTIWISFKPNLGGDTCQQLIGWKNEIKNNENINIFYYLHYKNINYYNL